MAFVKLYRAGSNRYCPQMGRHGVVHREDCGYALNAPHGRDWHRSDTIESADFDFPHHTLFWCSICIGINERNVLACMRAP